MSEEASYIDTKNDEKNKTKDISIGGFMSTLTIGILIIIIYFYIASINLAFAYKYSGSSGIGGQNVLLVPYTPYNTMAQYAMAGGKEAFKRMKLSGGFRLPSIDELFPMDSWSFPYKNKFTEKQYDRTHSENMEDVVFRIVSWFTQSMAATFSTGRFLLQMYLSGTKTSDNYTGRRNKTRKQNRRTSCIFIRNTHVYIVFRGFFTNICRCVDHCIFLV